MEDIKKTLSKKNKITIAIVIAALICAGVAAGFLLYNPLKIKKEEVTVEFGQPISTEASTYLKDDVKKNIVKKTKVTYKAKPVEGQTYDEIGDYIVTLKYEKKTAEVKVSVKDTTKPEFNATAESGIDTIEGVELDFKKLITATDLSGAEVTFDAKGVDLNKSGTYTLKATAKDKAGNEISKDIKVTVAEKPANMSGSTVTVDSKTGKVTIKSKTYSSNKASKSSGSSNKKYSGSKGSGSSSSSSSGGSSGYIPGSGHTYEDSGWEDWDGEW